MMSLLSSTLFLHRSMKATQRSEWVLQKSSETLDHHPYQRSPCQEYCAPHLHTAWCSFPWCLSSELSIYLRRLPHGENILHLFRLGRDGVVHRKNQPFYFGKHKSGVSRATCSCTGLYPPLQQWRWNAQIGWLQCKAVSTRRQNREM